MYFTSFEALEPEDLTQLHAVLIEVCADREIDINDDHVELIAQDLIDLWVSGFRSPEELKAMLRPL